MQTSLFTGSSPPANVATNTSTSSLPLRLKITDSSLLLTADSRQADVLNLATPPVQNHPDDLNRNSAIKDNLRMAWHGVESLLKYVERSLAGTPFQGPVAAVNILIELGNVCPSPTVSATFADIYIGRCRQQGRDGRTGDWNCRTPRCCEYGVGERG